MYTGNPAFCGILPRLPLNKEAIIMWILFAFGSALFAGLTAILAKVGLQHTDSDLATALRTIVVLLFSWIMVLVSGCQDQIAQITPSILGFLILSGLATGASWLCYFHALQLGDINKVTPIDKSSTVLTMLLAFVFLGEPLGWLQVLCMLCIGAGTWLMIQKKQAEPPRTAGHGWLFYAVGSALFASLTSILGKVGMQGIDSNLGTAIRTAVVLAMAWLIVFLRHKQGLIASITRRSWLFLGLSGLATGASWLCYYRALQTGPASVVVPIDKMSILVTIAFGRIVWKEKLTRRAAAGLFLLVCGTLLLLV